ncbi:MAG: DUF4433 domain-containing protein [Planctomycetota bacterium]
MNRREIAELHCIVPIENVPGIMQGGLLSHKRAEKVSHRSVAMMEIQERRKNRRIPGGGMLHEYANLYFDAHNPMLSKVRSENDAICVLRVGAEVLDLPGVIVTDRNAAADYARFSPVSEGLMMLDRDRIFARSWIHPENFNDVRLHKAQKCAEVLVPDRVEPRFVLGAYVANAAAAAKFQQLNIRLPVSVNGDIFF